MPSLETMWKPLRLMKRRWAAWLAMALTGWFAIVPLALVSLLTGLAMALVTRWGLFRQSHNKQRLTDGVNKGAHRT